MPNLIEIPGHGIVEFPDDMSNDEVLAAVKKLAGPPKLSWNPLAPGGSIAEGRAAVGVGKGFGPPLSMALPPATSVLGRAALQGAGAVGEKLLEGKASPSELGGSALKGAGWSLGADALLGPLGRFVGRQTGAKQATKAFEEATKAHEATKATKAFKEAHDVSMTKALNATETNAFERAMETAAQTGAADIAKDLVAKVPALKGTEISGKGLYDAIYGSGIGKVSTEFDRALKAVVEKGAGQVVQVPEAVALRYSLTPAASGRSGLPANVQALFDQGARRMGIQPKGPLTETTPGMVGVDAAELAQKMTGSWKKDPQSYRAAAKALDEADIGDPAARAAYKMYTGTGEFINKAKALDATGTLHLDKLLKNFADLKAVKGLERRDIGHGTEGMLQDVARRGPLAPTPRQVPIQQVPETPAPIPPDIKTSNIPWWGKHVLGGLAGGALGSAVGAPGWGAGLGSLLGHAVIPSQIVRKGPIAPAVTQATQAITGPLAVTGRSVQDYLMPDAE